MRAISNFLYGIPARSSDNFLHENKLLRIGATLQCADGQTAHFVRRKGNRDTLLDGDENPCADGTIDPFLGKVREELFLNMFGLSHQRLIEGGKAILSGKGDVGESIFAAGLGVAGLRQLLEELERKGNELFRPSGQNQKINQLVSAYNKAKAELRVLSLSARDYQEVAAALRAAEEERKAVAEKLSELANARARWRRLESAAPKAAKLDGLREERKALGGAAVLAEDFSRRRAENQRDRAAAEREIAELESELSELRKEIESTRVDEKILEREEEILAVFQRQGSYLKNQQDLPGLRHKRHNLREEAQRILRNLGLSEDLAEAEKLRLTAPQRLRIGAAIEELKTVRRRLSELGEQIAAAREEIDGKKVELAGLPPARETESLEALLKVANRDGDLTRQLAEVRRERAAVEENAGARLKRLLPPVGCGIEELNTLRVPPVETIERFGSEGTALDRERTRLDEKLREAEEQREELRLRIEAVRKGEEIPAEEDLAAARARRDRGWRLVRRSWEGEAVSAEEVVEFAAGEELADGYEASVVEADRTADLLRRESDRVAQLAQLGGERKRLEERIREHCGALEKLAGRRMDWEERWAEAWKAAGISPSTPVEMLSWHRDYEKLLEEAATIRERRGKQEAVEARIAELRERFREEGERGGLAVLRGDFALEELVVHAEKAVASVRERNLEREQLERSLGEAAKNLQRMETALREFREKEEVAEERWGEAVGLIGLGAEATLEEAQAILNGVGEAVQKLDEAAGLSGRISGVEKDCLNFERLVDALLAELGASGAGEDRPRIVHRLHGQLTGSKTNLATLTNLRKQVEEKERRLSAAKLRAVSLQAVLEKLLAEAGVEREADFERVEADSKRIRELEAAMSSLRDQLADLAGGGSVEVLVEEIRAVDAGTIPGEIRQVEAEEAEFQRRLTEVNERIGGLREKLSALDGSEAAAAKAEEMEATLAGLRGQVEEYGRVRLAAILLRREIERYRQRHQGPVLRCAGEYFGRLTLGSFAGLGTDFSEKDEQVLVGLRGDGTRVPVEAMSEGTCDQLYLALRLASLRHHIETNEPMPLILDDILVNFDDERSRATLEILAELSERNQIIYFTHHRHIVEIARELGEAAGIGFHELERGRRGELAAVDAEGREAVALSF